MKKCKKCHTLKDLSDYYRQGKGVSRRAECKACTKLYEIEFRRKNPESWKNRKERGKERDQEIREVVFEHYGPCTCCKESNIHFLSIDHINNDGAEHRRSIGGQSLYLWIIRNNFPDDLQSLCYNCNCAKQFSGLGFCPHKFKVQGVTPKGEESPVIIEQPA
jgi:hypothetical protein